MRARLEEPKMQKNLQRDLRKMKMRKRLLSWADFVKIIQTNIPFCQKAVSSVIYEHLQPSLIFLVKTHPYFASLSWYPPKQRWHIRLGC